MNELDELRGMIIGSLQKRYRSDNPDHCYDNGWNDALHEAEELIGEFFSAFEEGE